MPSLSRVWLIDLCEPAVACVIQTYGLTGFDDEQPLRADRTTSMVGKAVLSGE